jgi:hypothetical protein
MAVTPRSVSFDQSSRQAAGQADSFHHYRLRGDVDEHVLPVDPGGVQLDPGQSRAARSRARTFSPHMTRPVSVKP